MNIEIPYKTFSTLDGTLKETHEGINFALCKKIYRTMVLTRLFDEKAIFLQRTGSLGTYPSSYGQEGLHVGIGVAMCTEDVFCPYYREQGTHLCRGMKMEEILGFWGGYNNLSYSGPQHDLPYCIPIATQCLHAVGAAWAIQYKKQKRAVLVIIGDGGTSRGDFYEAMNAAGVWNLPLVFVINNNQYAISTKREQQTKAYTLAQKAIACGLECMQIDGNDVLGVQYFVEQALHKAYENRGATVIEALTYRLSDHTTSDDARRYRTTQEVIEAKVLDPIMRMKKFLTNNYAWTDADDKELSAGCQQEVEQATNNYLAKANDCKEKMFIHLYKNMPANVLYQMEECLQEGGE